jgi:phage gpG-like protein
MQELSQQMVNAVRENFATEGASLLGHKWQALKPATIKSKQKRKRPLQILRDSDDLQNSVFGRSTAREAIAGVRGNLGYEKIHQFGGEIYHDPITRTLRFKTNRKGDKLRKQKGYPNLVVFDKKGNKQNISYTMTQKSYIVNMPPRPYLGLGKAATQAAIDTVTNFLMK